MADIQSRKFLTPYFLVLVFLLASCSIFQAEQDHSQIEGHWEWMRSTGGFFGTTITPDSAGYSPRSLQFHNGSQFSVFVEDTLFLSGNYSIRYRDTRRTDGFEVVYTLYRNEYQDRQWASFPSRDSLILRDHCVDCFTHYYRRIE